MSGGPPDELSDVICIDGNRDGHGKGARDPGSLGVDGSREKVVAIKAADAWIRQ